MANLLSKYVVPGCRVDLQEMENLELSEIDEADGSEEVKTGTKGYQSKVIDILSEDRLEILMPMEKSKIIPLPVDGEYDLYFFTDSGLYQCYARVADRYKDNNMYVLVMDLISNLRKYQRREYYRLSCALEMDSRPLQLDEAKLAEAGRRDVRIPELPLKGSVIVDISGGGLRFVADYAYEVESLILCRYRLMIGKESKEYNLVGKVLAVKELENRPGSYEHRIQYVNMDSEEREEIIKYIFDEERRSLRKQKRSW